jgi:hypothetical protein
LSSPELRAIDWRLLRFQKQWDLSPIKLPIGEEDHREQFGEVSFPGGCTERGISAMQILQTPLMHASI